MQSFGDGQDSVGLVLKCHLFTEAMLDELVCLALAEHSEAVLSINLNYKQKLDLVGKLKLAEEFELLPDYVVGSLRRLNQIRNRIAHKLGAKVESSDVVALFVGLEGELAYDVGNCETDVALKRYLSFIFGHMLPKYEECDPET